MRVHVSLIPCIAALAVLAALPPRAFSEEPPLTPTPEGMAQAIRDGESESKEYVREAASQPDSGAISILSAAVEPGVKADIRKAAIDVALKHRPGVADKVLGQVMKSGDPADKSLVIKGADKLDEQVQFNVLKAALEDRTTKVREEAVDTILKLRSPSNKVRLMVEAAKTPERQLKIKILTEAEKMDRQAAYNVAHAFQSDRDGAIQDMVKRIKDKHDLHGKK